MYSQVNWPNHRIDNSYSCMYGCQNRAKDQDVPRQMPTSLEYDDEKNLNYEKAGNVELDI